MNVSQLSAFHAVMTSSTLTEAADRLGRTQPAVSAAIKSLEEQLGVKLFERRGRNLVPVPEAQYLLTEASSILSQLTRVRQTMRGLVAGQAGNLTVAAMPGPVSMLFPRFIAQHVGHHSGIKVSMFARSSNQIAELVRAQSIDFGFADPPESAEAESLYQADIISGNCFIALPADHLLAGNSTVCIDDLDHQPMGLLQANHAHTLDVRAAFDTRGVTLNTMIESQTFLPILQFVLAGQCASILDPLTVVHVQASSDLSGAIVIRPLRQTLVYRYAIFSPCHRPSSILATSVRDAWAAEVERLLTEVEAEPTWEHHRSDVNASS